jgi:hypothetical protein
MHVQHQKQALLPCVQAEHPCSLHALALPTAAVNNTEPAAPGAVLQLCTADTK